MLVRVRKAVRTTLDPRNFVVRRLLPQKSCGNPVAGPHATSAKSPAASPRAPHFDWVSRVRYGASPWLTLRDRPEKTRFGERSKRRRCGDIFCSWARRVARRLTGPVAVEGISCNYVLSADIAASERRRAWPHASGRGDTRRRVPQVHKRRTQETETGPISKRKQQSSATGADHDPRSVTDRSTTRALVWAAPRPLAGRGTIREELLIRRPRATVLQHMMRGDSLYAGRRP